jgi:hypothetical protein
MKIKKIYFDGMDYSAVYLQPNELEGLIESHYKRPIVKIKSLKNERKNNLFHPKNVAKKTVV